MDNASLAVPGAAAAGVWKEIGLTSNETSTHPPQVPPCPSCPSGDDTLKSSFAIPPHN